ncbi:MAG TPA: type B DNA-directed DNA polymerase, partial [Candidatus Bathyarchaeota archaeon]|nr:type B DNA-directed DNA polymerase [Candidatus Bathyarchaeota archaeon]
MPTDVAGKAEEVSDLPKPSYLIGVGYDGERGRAFLKLYEPESQRIYLYYDRTGHMPYCLSNLTVEEIKQNPRVSGYRGIVSLEPVERYDPLHDRTVRMTKIVVSNPLAVGGRGGVRELIPTW